MGTVFAEMSSWIALTCMYTVMKTAHKNKYMNSDFLDLYYEDFKF